MPTRYEFMELIKQEFEDNLTIENGFNVEPVQIVIGFPRPESIKQYPTLCIYMISDPIFEENLDVNRERIANILVVGYTSTTEEIYKLSEDVEKFLYSTTYFTYGDQTQLDPAGPTFSIGGVTEAVGLNMFDLQFVLNYTQEL